MPLLSKAFQQGLLPFLLLQLLLPSITVADCNTAITATTNHLVDNNSGTVSDSKTGLIWKKCSEGQSYNSSTNSCDGVAGKFNWQAALQQAQAVNAGGNGESLGQTDWRVPNIKELASIVELSCYSPTIDEQVFPATSNKAYWSFSLVANVGYRAWIVSFFTGKDYAEYKDYSGSVRLVRSGQ